jgi:hypothetical protein
LVSTFDTYGPTWDSGLTYDIGEAPGIPHETLLPSPALKLNYSDVAVATDLVRPIGTDDRRIYPRTLVGYPVVPFLVTLDKGKLNQEIVLATYVGANYIDVDRSFGDSGLYAHGIGATVEHTTTAFDYNTGNHHVHDPKVDWHPQYMDAFRHLSPPRHMLVHTLDGVQYGSIPVGPPGPSKPGDISDQGTSMFAAASDHIHPRETISDIVTHAIPPNVICFVPTQKKTAFYWLDDTVEELPSLYPVPYVPSGVTIPLSDLGQPSEAKVTFGGRAGALAPSVDPEITGFVQHTSSNGSSGFGGGGVFAT